jgi:S-adenosylmethionine:tRNA ribosyltransferase-isomerase
MFVPYQTSDFDYVLPADRIASDPAEPRDSSRLLVVDRQSGTLQHRTFRDLASLIPAGDALVLNTSRVVRARLLGRRDGSGAAAEVMLLRPLDNEYRYEALVHPGGKLHAGRVVSIAPDLAVEIESVTERRTRIVRLRTPLGAALALERYGHVPLPPYIERPDTAQDAERYQTVYAREPGSVAAPTAGLHFTPLLLDTLRGRGVEILSVVLHVGAGTFKPVEVENPAEHVMHEEWYEVPSSTAASIESARARGSRIWAVGTTTARTLESAARGAGIVQAGAAETRLFIQPGYDWRVVDRLITNFHLPRSTLLMLVAAFAGYDLTMRAYREAIGAGYRFYSYGDAMAVV